MRVLGIDTATRTASAGVIDDDRLLAERSLAAGGSHAAALLPLIESVLDAAHLGIGDLDLLAVAIGPGSFTGLRVGLSVAKGLALACAKPIVGAPTLEAYARGLGPRAGLVCPVLDARKREVYAAVFRWIGDELREVRAPDVVSPEDFASRLEMPCTLIGEGVDAYAALWRTCLGDAAELLSASALQPMGTVVARLGRLRYGAVGSDDLATLEPAYVRRSEAELGRHSDGRRNDLSPVWKN